MDPARLTYMANQIARNLAPQGEAEAVAATAQHIRDYWDPRMRAGLLASDPGALEPVARQARDRLAAEGAIRPG